MGKLAKIVGLRLCSLLTRPRPAPGIPVLAYHSVDDSGSYLSTAPEIFEMEIACLAKLGYRGVSISHLMSMVEDGKPVPPETVALTFDDGLRNFRDTAWPVLDRAGFSATIYVPTDFVGKTTTWYSDHHLKPMPVLSWNDLRDLRGKGADVQSHGCSHRRLSALPEHEMLAELRQSRAAMRENLDGDIKHFCYPFGDFNDSVKAAAKVCGYKSAVATIPGRYRVGDDPHEIRRDCLDYVNIADAATVELVIGACMEGSYSKYVRAKVALRRLCGLDSGESAHN